MDHSSIFTAVTRELAQALDDNPNITTRLRTALLVAMRGNDDVKSVGALAVACRCDRSTLWRQWKQAIGKDINPKQVLTLVRLLRSLALHKMPQRGSFAHDILQTEFNVRAHDQLDLITLVKQSRRYEEVLAALRGEKV